MLLGSAAVGLLLLRRVNAVEADLVLRPAPVEDRECVAVCDADYTARSLAGPGNAAEKKPENKDR